MPTAAIEAIKEETLASQPVPDERKQDVIVSETEVKQDAIAVTVKPETIKTMDESPSKTIPSMVENKVLVDPKYVIPASGVEVVPLATLASLDLNGNGAEGGLLEMTAENSIGSLLVVITYQSVLTALKSEASRRNGDITRKQQVQLIVSTAMESGRSSAFTLIVCSALISIFPWLTPIFAILGIVGGSAMAMRITNEFWSALDDSQKDELKRAADKAKVNLDKLIPQEMTVAPAAA